MAHIKIRIAAHVRKRCVLGTEINRVRPSVGGQGGQSVAESTLELHLQSIVVRCQSIVVKDHFCAVLKVWINWLNGGGPLLQQSSSVRTHIRYSDRLRVAQGLLNAHIPLKCIRQLQMGWKRPRVREWWDRRIHDRRS